METISVTGSRLPAQAVPGSVEVIDAALIEARGNPSVSDLLRHVPGVQVSRPGGAAAELFMRGAEANFTTILIDGVRVNNPANSRGGSYDFSTVDAAEIERIEIIRGPVSAVFGADALSGVINIITRGAVEEPVVAFGGELGGHDYSRLHARAASPLSDRWSTTFFAARSNAPEAVAGYTAELDTVQGRLDYADADRSGALRLRYSDSQQTAFPDASGGPLFAVSRELEQFDAQEWTAAAEAQQRITPSWTGQISGSIFEREEAVLTPAIFAGPLAVAPTADGASRYRSRQVLVNNQISLGSRLRLAAGAEVRQEIGEQAGTISFGTETLPTAFDLERTIYGGFLEGGFSAPWLTAGQVEILGSARWDDPDGFASRVSKRLAASYRHARSGMRLHLGWTDGFKLPSFYALGDNLFGNPGLLEERAAAVELGLQLPLPRQRMNIELSAYASEYRDLIDFDFATFRLVNRSRVNIDGVEGKLSSSPQQRLRFDLQLAYTEIDVEGSADSLPLRSKWSGGFATIWRPSRQWTVQANAVRLGSRRASSVATGDVTLSGYTRVDFAATRKVRDAYLLKFAVDNVLDAQYREDAGVPSPGVVVRVGAEVRL